jgi:hypothetical protein
MRVRDPLSILFALVTAALLLPAGCASHRKVLLPSGSPLIEQKDQDLSLGLRFLNELELERLFGVKGNPFLPRRSLLPYLRLLVFELTAVNREAGRLRWSLRGCEIAFGGKILLPIAPAGLAAYWESKDRNPETSRTRSEIIAKFMLPPESTVYPGEVLRGYLVFRAARNPQGPARVKIVLSVEGKKQQFDFEYQF